MKFLLILFFLPVSIAGCSGHKASLPEHFCVIRFDSLINKIDTPGVIIARYSIADSIEVRDTTVSRTGEGSVFEFDSSGKLCRYAFMVSWPYSNFIINYDVSGRKKRVRDNEVVQWRYPVINSDSIMHLTVLLCAVDRNYGDLSLKAGNFVDSVVVLQNTQFTKIICFKSDIPLKKNFKNTTIYLRGQKEEKCSGRVTPFVDSLILMNRSVGVYEK